MTSTSIDAGFRHWSRTAWKDPFIQAAVGLGSVLGAIFALRPFGEEGTRLVADSLATLAWLVLCCVALVVGLRRLERRERRFWLLLAGAWGSWTLAELINALEIVNTRTTVGSTLIDSVYFLYYLSWLQAIETRPHLDAGSAALVRIRRVVKIGRSLFALGLFLYFVVLPQTTLPEVYFSWVPSYTFYLTLDVYILARLLGILWRCTDPRWRVLFGLLAGAAGAVATTDCLELLWVLERLELPMGEAGDYLWYVPMFLVIVATRVRGRPFPAAPRTEDEEPEGVRAVPLLAYSVIFPGLHLVLELVAPSPAGLERPRQALVLVWLLLLGGFNLVQYLRIQALNRELTFRRREAEERVRFLSRHDALTGLPNRREVEKRLAEALARSRRERRSIAVMFVDLDGFKEVNDSFGHVEGDRILRDAAQGIRSCIRESDSAGRYGGDEFVLVLEALDQVDEAGLVAERTLAALSRDRFVGERAVTMSATIGIAVYPRDGETAEKLIEAADAAMYRAKSEGGRRYRFAAA